MNPDMNEFQGRNVFRKIFFPFPFWYDQMHSSPWILYSPFFFLSKQRGETLQAFWFLLPPRHCHITVTDTEKPRQPAACKILSFFKFDFGFEAGAQLRSWRESACQGKSLLHGKKSPGITPHLQCCGSGTRQGKVGRWNGEELILI